MRKYNCSWLCSTGVLYFQSVLLKFLSHRNFFGLISLFGDDIARMIGKKSASVAIWLDIIIVKTYGWGQSICFSCGLTFELKRAFFQISLSALRSSETCSAFPCAPVDVLTSESFVLHIHAWFSEEQLAEKQRVFFFLRSLCEAGLQVLAHGEVNHSWAFD